MRITAKLSMAEYDAHVREHLPGKIPDWGTHDPRRWVGDAIYAFDADPPRMRRGVHGEGHRAKDLSGGFPLLSEHFYYLGDLLSPSRPTCTV